MSYAIGFVAGVIFVFAGLWFGALWADAARTEDHRRKVERNRRTYGTFDPGASEPAEDAREAAAERKAA